MIPIPEGEWTHVVMVDREVDGVYSVLHTTWYLEKPTTQSILSLVKELRTDPEFGLTEICDQCMYRVLTREEFEEINQTL